MIGNICGIKRLQNESDKVGPPRAWNDVLRTSWKRDALSLAQTSLTSICDYAANLDGSLDESGLPKQLAEQYDLSGKEFDATMNTLVRAKSFTRNALVRKACDAMERAQQLFSQAD